MCERACGKLPSCRPRARVVLLGEQAHVVAQRRAAARRARAPRRGGPAAPGCRRARTSRRGTRPRRAAGRRRRDSVSVAQHEAVLHQLALDRGDGAAHARVVRRQEADQRHQQQARVEVARAVGLHEGVAAGSKPLAADVGVDGVARARASDRTGPRSPNCLGTLAPRGRTATHAITLECVKCRRRPAHLPDALVGLASTPSPGAPSARAAAPTRASGRRASPARRACVQRVQHLAVDVELELVAAALPMRTGRRARVARAARAARTR